jgi:hypothetical protein
MMDKVRRIARNPIAHMTEEDPTDFYKLESQDDNMKKKSCCTQ